MTFLRRVFLIAAAAAVAALAQPGSLDRYVAQRDPVYAWKVVTTLPGNGTRTDVGAVYPAFGPAHGYSTTLTAARGAHTVCAYAINVGAGTNRLLGCRSVTVP